MGNSLQESAAIRAARAIREHCPLAATPEFKQPIGLVLGTGWGDAIQLKDMACVPFNKLPGFNNLAKLTGHKRQVEVGYLAGKPVVVLNGRIHLNEAPADQQLYRMVRLQTEMLFLLTVKTLIVTSAVGALKGHGIDVGDIAVINSLITLFAPDMPLWAGEFCSPEDALSQRLIKIALAEQRPLTAYPVSHAMVRGPFFESRRHDKDILAKSGANVVGMSLLPEACIAALYNAEVLGLGFVTNSPSEKHSHAENLERAKTASTKLGGYLTRIIQQL